ncbi:hypothetical protein RMN57_17890 [Kitasatospora sp. CM 4170]|uniref:Uncharacterized protein n=1 Tax=Kitasatospora aburaviensis TaxID=67265 RepID=A0ABW1EXR4_9ACTN|nr:hypothetical protein [Kitasatospora sp. CM 4170]WNM46439.1 hypothetical protein RMN57_17890 [Kitasatospora sp. CM 4170]
MPTPHGSRGGMAFSADEVRVLRRALAQALHPAAPVHLQGSDRLPFNGTGAELWAEDVQDALRLTEAINEAVQEGGRLRAFLLADLARYRAALPGSAGGYLERLEEAVTDGYLPGPEDLTALRGLTRQPCGQHERSRRSRLAGRCHALAEAAVRERLALTTGQRHLVAVPSPAAPPSSLPIPVGGRIPMSSTEPTAAAKQTAPTTTPRPHRMPTPAELFGRRPKPPARPAPPTAGEELELATGTG